MLIDQLGKLIRLPASEVRTMGRQAKGVRLIKLEPNQMLSTMVAFEEAHDDDTHTLEMHTSTGDAGTRATESVPEEGLQMSDVQHSLFSMDLDDMPRMRAFGSDDDFIL